MFLIENTKTSVTVELSVENVQDLFDALDNVGSGRVFSLSKKVGDVEVRLLVTGASSWDHNASERRAS